MTTENLTEWQLRVAAEMTVMRNLLTCLFRQSSDAKALLEDFEQCLEESRHAGEVHTGQKDEHLDFFADLYRGSIAAAVHKQRQLPG